MVMRARHIPRSVRHGKVMIGGEEKVVMEASALNFEMDVVGKILAVVVLEAAQGSRLRVTAMTSPLSVCECR